MAVPLQPIRTPILRRACTLRKYFHPARRAAHLRRGTVRVLVTAVASAGKWESMIYLRLATNRAGGPARTRIWSSNWIGKECKCVRCEKRIAEDAVLDHEQSRYLVCAFQQDVERRMLQHRRMKPVSIAKAKKTWLLARERRHLSD